jgi:exonuclease V
MSKLDIFFKSLHTADQDEISLKTIPDPEVEPNPHGKRAPTSTGRTSQRSNKRRELSPSQSHVMDFFTSPSKAKASRSPSPICPMVHELSLKDTKTRRFNSLPSDDDALSSRMQLMLYRHLLSSLLSPTFSFSAFWEKIGVDPFVQFSDEFLLKAGLARETDGTVVLGYPACLDDLADLWRSTVHSLRLKSVSPILEIVYRTQPKHSAAPNPTRVDTLYDFAAADREARDIARAIEASLRENGYDPDLERAIAESLRDVTPAEECSAAVVDDGNSIAGTRSPSARGSEQPPDMPHIRWYGRSGEVESASAPSGSVEGARPMEESNTAELGSSGSQVPPSQSESSRVIGRKSFAFDEAAMQAHLQDVLQWWRGERPPRGVDLEHSRRCL